MSKASEAVTLRMKELQSLLKEAANAYYNLDAEIMSNYEYDELYDELVSLEKETGIFLDGSITSGVGVELVDTGLGREKHSTKMLSLAKTKSREELSAWLGDKEGCLSWKLDGSTVVLTYDNGILVKSVTRGDGETGEVITEQTKLFRNVPETIPFKGLTVIRGEALMTYEEFERINATIEDEGMKYKNPRNLASGTMRALDFQVLRDRGIDFVAFSLISADGADNSVMGSYCSRLDWVKNQGFQTVERTKVNQDSLLDNIQDFESRVQDNSFPSDGLVLFYEDTAYGDSLGVTSHAPRNGIAFKWADETKKTILRDIFWSPSRTGRLNPVAVFDAVLLEGTTVERASVHNLTYMKDMKLGIGDEIEVYKANMIIPQIAKNFTCSGKDVSQLIPKECPACHQETLSIRCDHESDVLVCTNDQCIGKLVGNVERFVCRDAFDIKGLSSETLTKFQEAGIVCSYKDILNLASKKYAVVGHIEGIGEKSFSNIVDAVERSKRTTAARFLYSLGIREIGRSASRDICARYNNDMEAILEADEKALSSIDGIGTIMAREFVDYVEKNKPMILELLDEIVIVDKGAVPSQSDDSLKGLTFVVTGALNKFENRDHMKKAIESMGGKMSGSISAKTACLVTNTPDSGTSKNAKAQNLGVAILTEEEFIEKYRVPVSL